MTDGGERSTSEHPLVYVSFYKFAKLPDYEELRLSIKNKCDEQGVAGGIIVAPEGINGSICGTRAGIDSVLSFLRSDPRFKGMRNTEGPGPAEASPSNPLTGASRVGDVGKEGGSSGSTAEELKATPFQQDRVHVKVKKEVVPLGVDVDPTCRVGTYVKPADWNALLEDPEVVVVDVRNEYETRIGKFKGAVDPCTISFKDFPGWVEKNLLQEGDSDRASRERGTSTTNGPDEGREDKKTDGVCKSTTRGSERDRREDWAENGVLGAGIESSEGTEVPLTRSRDAVGSSERSDAGGPGLGGQERGGGEEAGPAGDQARSKKVAMYCTGGIRCEKSTSLLLQMGFEKVYHLEGGILRYLHEVPPEESLWEGECFVFDRRTSVKHGMEPGSYSLCFACKAPITPEERESPLFITGVQCPLCAHTKTEKQKERDRQRQMQFDRYGMIGGALKKKPSKKAAIGTRRGIGDSGRVGTWVTSGVQERLGLLESQ